MLFSLDLRMVYLVQKIMKNADEESGFEPLPHFLPYRGPGVRVRLAPSSF